MKNNILIAFFSREGGNYFGGKIIDLKTGNTEIIARKLSSLTNGELFKIDPKEKYSSDYTACTEQAKEDLAKGARPELTNYPEDISGYDTVILCYPNYWSTMPVHVFAFLEHYDFGGKKILPLCTHEGSGMGKSEADLKKTCPSSDIKAGLAIRGSDAQNCDEELKSWLKANNII